MLKPCNFVDIVSYLPDSDIVGDTLGKDLVTVLAVTSHTYYDREERAEKSPAEELLAALKTLIFARVQPENCDRKR